MHMLECIGSIFITFSIAGLLKHYVPTGGYVGKAIVGCNAAVLLTLALLYRLCPANTGGHLPVLPWHTNVTNHVRAQHTHVYHDQHHHPDHNEVADVCYYTPEFTHNVYIGIIVLSLVNIYFIGAIVYAFVTANDTTSTRRDPFLTTARFVGFIGTVLCIVSSVEFYHHVLGCIAVFMLYTTLTLFLLDIVSRYSCLSSNGVLSMCVSSLIITIIHQCVHVTRQSTDIIRVNLYVDTTTWSLFDTGALWMGLYMYHVTLMLLSSRLYLAVVMRTHTPTFRQCYMVSNAWVFGVLVGDGMLYAMTRDSMWPALITTFLIIYVLSKFIEYAHSMWWPLPWFGIGCYCFVVAHIMNAFPELFPWQSIK